MGHYDTILEAISADDSDAVIEWVVAGVEENADNNPTDLKCWDSAAHAIDTYSELDVPGNWRGMSGANRIESEIQEYLTQRNYLRN